jgi:osmotically inducible lipoprotein OsmB
MALSRPASFRNRFVTLTLAGVAVIAIAGCYGQPLSTREKGTLAGGAIGAGSGAIVGAAVGAPLAGAAIGGVVGAGTGMAIGNSLQNNENHQRYAD